MREMGQPAFLIGEEKRGTRIVLSIPSKLRTSFDSCAVGLCTRPGRRDRAAVGMGQRVDVLPAGCMGPPQRRTPPRMTGVIQLFAAVALVVYGASLSAT